MEEAWGAKVYDHAGATEIGAWSFECEAQPGGMHVNEGLFLVEIVDVETGEMIEEPGRQGKMIITALDRQAQPCVRFDSKDIIEWDPEPCPCGRSFRLIKGGVMGRADDITKVKGVLLAPSAIEEAVRGVDGLGDEYEVVVDKVGDIDRITLRVELKPEASVNETSVNNRLVDQLRVKTNLGYNIEFHDYGSLAEIRGQGKAIQGPAQDALTRREEMSPEFDIERLDRLIQEMKRIAGEVAETGHEIPAVVRNVKRILASIKMLEINVSDVSEILREESSR